MLLNNRSFVLGKGVDRINIDLKFSLNFNLSSFKSLKSTLAIRLRSFFSIDSICVNIPSRYIIDSRVLKNIPVESINLDVYQQFELKMSIIKNWWVIKLFSSDVTKYYVKFEVTPDIDKGGISASKRFYFNTNTGQCFQSELEFSRNQKIISLNI